jgi:acetyl esterase/lipase
VLFFVAFQRSTGRPFIGPKLIGQSMSPYVALLGIAGATLGTLSGTYVPLVAGLAGAGGAILYVVRVVAPHDGFARAFGPDWQVAIQPEQAARMLPKRWSWRLPRAPEPRVERGVPFARVPGSEQPLCAAIWQPPRDVPPSGLALVYANTGGWSFPYPERWLAPTFRHLTAQGHVVMSVYPRTWRESDLPGIVGDVKRAVHWMKEHAETHHVDPERVVVAGASAGGHLALTAAYADHPALTPDELQGRDLTVAGVVAYYPPTDLARFHHHCQRWDQTRNVFGGAPEELPDLYALLSPSNYVSADCPPTLLFQGTHDSDVPVQTTRALHRRLVDAGVPSVYVEFPFTEHAFDLPLPRLAPAGQAALYDLERFLALICNCQLAGT